MAPAKLFHATNFDRIPASWRSVLACLCALSFFFPVVSAEDTARPNIILIMADDMNDGCCCNEEIARENRCFSSSSERN